MAARQRFPLNYAIAMPSSAEALLVHQLECSRLLHQERGASAELATALDRVAQWQSRRLNATYADLAVDPRYAGAIAFSERAVRPGRLQPTTRTYPRRANHVSCAAQRWSKRWRWRWALDAFARVDRALVGKLDATLHSPLRTATRTAPATTDRAGGQADSSDRPRRLLPADPPPSASPLAPAAMPPARAHRGAWALQEFLREALRARRDPRFDTFLEAINTRRQR
jgi:hypothetical protein